MNMIALRRRLPLIVCVVVAIFCLVAIGFACACFTDHQSQAVERALSVVPASPAPGSDFLWPMIVISLLAATAVMVGQREAVAARSPAELQRFLF
jgi:hypothetical protein